MISYRILFFILIMAIITSYVCYIRIDGFHGENAVAALLWRVLLFIALLICGLWFSSVLGEFLKRSLGRRWWNMSASDSADAPNWASLVHMLCNDRCDPLVFEENGYRPDGISKFQIFQSIPNNIIFLIILFIGILYGMTAFYILQSMPPNLLLIETGIKDTSINGNIAAYIAFVGTALTVIFAYQQIRAKVRADSRQAWVNKVRELISDVLANIGGIIENGRVENDFKEFNKARTHLELHLNPSEADHRLLMFLIRACAFPDLLIGNDRIVLDEVSKALSKNGQKIRSISNTDTKTSNIDALENLVLAYSKNSANSKCLRKAVLAEHKDEIISFIFRLSHNILKREWERVRHTK